MEVRYTHKLYSAIVLALLLLFSNDMMAVTVNTLSQLKNAPANSICEISGRLDLSGAEIMLNPGIVLKFNGGRVSNGTLIGNNTAISGTERIFEDIIIKGSWNVPNISTTMFVDFSKDDSIKNVFALSDARIKNTIVINPGTYWVNADVATPSLIVNSNTEVILNGDVLMRPNDKTSYHILRVEGDNIDIHGYGRVVGEKNCHLGQKGEWGMGISIYKSSNVTVSGITVEQCWGDCIYIYQNSTHVVVRNCVLKDSRRQGISIISADDVLIDDCIISGIGGCAPGLAIDVEPNEGNVVDNVKVSRIRVSDCEAGFSASGLAENSYVGSVSVSNSEFNATKRNYNVLFVQTQKSSIMDCQIESGTECGLWFSLVKNAVYKGNTLVSHGNNPVIIYKCGRIRGRRNTIIHK